MPVFNTSGLMGIDFASRKAGTTTDGAGAEFPMGMLAFGGDGTIWRYVQANAAIAKGDYVCIGADNQCRKGTKALVDGGHTIGVAQAAFADDELGWVLVQGVGVVNVLISCSASIPLSTTGTSGFLDDIAATATQRTITGIQLVTSVTASGTATAILNHPVAALQGLAWTAY